MTSRKQARSERAAKRARRRQNQRIFLIALLVFAVGAFIFSLFGDQFQTASSSGDCPVPAGLVTTASGLAYEDLVAGSGQLSESGQRVSVHYDGTLENGTPFDSSRQRGVPFEFTLGQGGVIAGWDEGVAGMCPGQVRRLIIPGDLGYGAVGSPPVIPPNATLIFEVELLAISP
jgi:peptidylprolyl isomerase